MIIYQPAVFCKSSNFQLYKQYDEISVFNV